MKASSSIKAIGFLNADTSSKGLSIGIRSVWAWVLLGGLVAGTLDLLFAMGWWALRDVAPIRIVQAVAAWALGRDAAFAGGWTTAALGTALHYYLMTAMVAGYHLASRRHSLLLRYPVCGGALYGALMFVLLHMVVLPLLSSATPTTFRPDWMLACLLVYMLLVGIPSALFARRWHASRARR